MFIYVLWVQPVPGMRSLAATLQTIAPTARYLDGELEYNRHNLFGLSTVIGSYKALNTIIPNKRPFILSRYQH